MKNNRYDEQQLLYPQCPLHTTETLQLVCLTCTENPLACPICIDNGHHRHQVISLKKFMTYEISKIMPEEPDYELFKSKMQVMWQNSLYGIERLRRKVNQEINDLDEFFQGSSERFESQLRFLCGVFNEKESADSLAKNVQAASILIKQEVKLPTKAQLSKKIVQHKDLTERAIDQACSEIRRIIQGLKQFSSATNDLFLNSRNLNLQYFDSENKQKYLEIVNHTKLINKKYDNSYHTCIALPPLTPFRSSIKFHITKARKKCIWVGITDLQSLKSSEYLNTYKAGGYHYMIWQSGGESEAELYAEDLKQRPKIGWNFEEGDEITIRIFTQAKDKYVQFIKSRSFKEEEQKDKEKLKQKQKEKGEQPKVQTFRTKINKQVGYYYACVSLGDKDQCVKIINV